MQQESKLIEGCISGERRSQNELYSLYSGLFFGICLRYAGNRNEAQDMLQEGFIRIFSKISTYKGQGSFEGWMKRIIVNTALNYVRDHSKERLLISLPDSYNHVADESPQEEILESLSTDEMMALIQNLPDGYRIVFNLYVFENNSHKEIAEELNISENTSKTQLMRARLHLRKLIIERHTKMAQKV
jgi:RNA polymerase sigma-70 factor (ECF subfamily)